ncbi:MAG: OmpA family protein [Chlorobi bacterium]|nr:OmpA family protein [Chlorobiota bacterium]
MKALFWCTCVVATGVALYAQSTPRNKPWLYVGGWVAYQNNIQSADFQSLPNAFRCGPNYTTGTGGVGSFGVLATYPLGDVVTAELRLGYAPLSGRLFRNEIIGNTADISGANRTTTVESMHELFTTFPALVVEPVLGGVLFRRVRVGIGMRISYLLDNQFRQLETLTQPDYVFYLPDSSRTRNRATGMVENLYRMQYHLSLSAGVDFPLAEELTITPELRYYFPLVPVTRDVKWHIAPIAIGAAVRYALYPPPPPRYFYDTVYVRDTSTIASVGLEREEITRLAAESTTVRREEKQGDQLLVYSTTTITERYERRMPRAALLSIDVAVRPLRSDGSPLDSVARVVIEETEVEESFPLLPQVFFPEGSSTLDLTRLQLLQPADTADFDEKRLPPATLDIYRHLLNIVGSRMRRHPAAKLVITGTNANAGPETGNIALSQARAAAVRDYLVRVWGIDPNRITIRARNLPVSPSNTTTPEGQEENRRAELAASNPDILRPVTISNVSVNANPPLVEFLPRVESEIGIASWQAAIEQEGKNIRSLSGQATPEPYRWNVTEQPYPKLDKPVTVTYTVRDRTGQTMDKTLQLDVQQLTVRQKRFEQRDDKRIDRFSLIVFDFNKAELTPSHRQLLADVKSRIQPQSKIVIAGYADRSGDPDYNRELARRRCIEVQRALELPDDAVTIVPKGSDELLYDNAIPEGRSYCRTVQITIETPIANGGTKE